MHIIIVIHYVYNTCTQADPGSSDSEVLQSYLQMLYQQSEAEGGRGGGDSGDNASNLMATSTLLQQV